MAKVYKYKDDPYVMCPYYCKESAIEIRCMGIIGLHCTHDFKSAADKQEYKDDFCCGLYTSCPLFLDLQQDELN
jgi:hypothetical protein